MKDFDLRFKVDEIENPKGLSVFNDKPKYIVEREKDQLEKEEKERLEAEKMQTLDV